MANMMQTGQSWLAGRLKAHAASGVVYDRAGQTVALDATFGSTTFETLDAAGLPVETESRDFLVTAADLVIDGQATTPQRGDIITHTVGATTFRYELLAIPGAKPWRYSDAFRTMIRVHTKLVRTDV